MMQKAFQIVPRRHTIKLFISFHLPSCHVIFGARKRGEGQIRLWLIEELYKPAVL